MTLCHAAYQFCLYCNVGIVSTKDEFQKLHFSCTELYPLLVRTKLNTPLQRFQVIFHPNLHKVSFFSTPPFFSVSGQFPHLLLSHNALTGE